MTAESNPFDPKKLKVARQLHGFTQVELAERLGVSRQFLHQIESGIREPNEEMCAALAATLYVEKEFFAAQLRTEITSDDCNFRCLESSKVRDLEQVVAHGVVLSELMNLLEQELEFPAADFPYVKVESVEDAERAAERARLHWGLTSDQPIDSTIRVAENAGAVVVKFPGISPEIDALSVCSARPLIVRTSEKEKPTRLRFDVAHEIGHLVMHQKGGRPEHDYAENQANRFASAFLLPRRAFVREFPRGRRLDWHAIFALKRRWKVSAQAILRRAYDLQLIDAAQYRSGNVFISKQGYKRNEPFEPSESEFPELLKSALIELQRAEGLLPKDVAKRLCVQPVLLGKLLDIAIPDLKNADSRTVVSLNERMDWSKAKWGSVGTSSPVKDVASFELIKPVLDQLYDDVVAEHGARNSVSVIKEKILELSSSYKRLRDPDFPPIDYAPPETRFAYVYSYVATHADLVLQVLNIVEKQLKGLLKSERIVATCLGGGPGSELLALLQFLSGSNTSVKALTVYLCDRVQAWADCWTEIGEAAPSPVRLNANFQRLDVTDQSSWAYQRKFLSADIFISNYFASEVARLGDKADAFWADLELKSNSGALMLIIDNDQEFFSRFVARHIIKDSWEVLVRETEDLTPIGTSQTMELEEKLGASARSPRLKSDLAFWLLRKK